MAELVPERDGGYGNWITVVIIGLLCLGLLAYCAIPKLLTNGGHSKVGAASGDIGAFNSALALYFVDTDSGPYPTTMNQLLTDNAVGWGGPYMATIGPDPWGNTYVYTGGTDNYTILSIHESDYHKSETIRYILSDGVLSTLP